MTAGWTIVSGGQTGVDRAALDAARMLGLPYGGYVPRGRHAEDGPLPDDYAGMVETESARYPVRTRRNVATSDATLIVTRGAPDGGTLLTIRTAEALGKPLLCVDLETEGVDVAAAKVMQWLGAMAPGRLNVAGPRESRMPGLQAEARAFLVEALAEMQANAGD